MATEQLGYTDKDERNEKARKLKAEGKRHVNKYSTHEGRKIIYVVTWGEPSQTVVEEKTHESGNSISNAS